MTRIKTRLLSFVLTAGPMAFFLAKIVIGYKTNGSSDGGRIS